MTPPGQPRVRSVSSYRRSDLRDGWELCSSDPDAGADPAALAALCPVWQPAVVPGTVADTLRRAGMLDLDHPPLIDDRDWWYRCRFEAEPNAASGTRVLRFDGLATLAHVWLNGRLILASDNMFIASDVDVSGDLSESNELVIRFRSLSSALGVRRPRPRWKTKLVDHQQLRWIRTTLLGRMPGWSPLVKPVGPWRSVVLESRELLSVEQGDLTTTWTATGGHAVASIVVRTMDGVAVRGAVLTIAGEQCELSCTTDNGAIAISGSMRVASGQPWWPHTHGEQPLYDATVVLATNRGDVRIDLGPVAFRAVEVLTEDGGFALHVNGVPVFCRGACWTTPDIVTLGSNDRGYRSWLVAARDAGMNMLRVGGTMTYEADAFYDWCDRLGILVWQDFMFANMDYPASDETFARSVEREVASNLARIRRHPSLAVLCGGSEVEQQAAMLGIPVDQWGRPLFHEQLPARCAELAPNVPYWPASPGGGALPFHADTGVTHYYGVGAYVRPLDDARRANVRFASECLAFSNVPDQTTIDALLPSGESPSHHPRWKARVPRDHGAGWDFEDVRDHYLETLYGVHPMRLRYADMDRYLALSRVVTGEVMARTIGEWRRAGSSCHGALVWFFQDLWPGAGWGLIDATGRPKAAYYAVRQAMQPVALAITDEGVNGLHVHVANDHATNLRGDVRVTLFRDGRTCVASGTAPIVVPARTTSFVSADGVLGQFRDVSHAYRFGPPGHDLVVASFTDANGARLSDAFHFPLGLPSDRHADVGLIGGAERGSDGSVRLTVRAERFAQSVAVGSGAAVPDENYFHLAPGDTRVVRFAAESSAGLREVFVQPLNAHEGLRVAVPPMGSVRA